MELVLYFRGSVLSQSISGRTSVTTVGERGSRGMGAMCTDGGGADNVVSIGACYC